jgi:hypothetical protein
MDGHVAMPNGAHFAVRPSLELRTVSSLLDFAGSEAASRRMSGAYSRGGVSAGGRDAGTSAGIRRRMSGARRGGMRGACCRGVRAGNSGRFGDSRAGFSRRCGWFGGSGSRLRGGRSGRSGFFFLSAKTGWGDEDERDEQSESPSA